MLLLQRIWWFGKLFFCSIFAANRVVTQLKSAFRYIQQTEVEFRAVQKGANFWHIKKTTLHSLHFHWFCAGVYVEKSIWQAWDITGKIYQNFFFLFLILFFSFRTVFLPWCQFYFFHKLLQQLNPLKSGHFIAP